MNLLLILALLQAPAAGGAVQGVVVNTGNEPLFTARVELSGGAQGPARGPMVARTDGQGKFVFPNVPAGRYKISAKKEGFVRQENGSVIVVAAGTPVPAITFRLQPAATITGAVRNEDGFPIANILVQAMRQSYGVRGNRTVTLFSNTLTDDLGAYRLYWVDPGAYYVNASYLPQLPTPVNANEDAPRAAYAPTYFPGSTDAREAKPIAVNGGSVTGGIDFKLQRSPAVKVRGTIYSILTQGATQATVVLSSPEESGSTSRYSIQTDEKGVFEMKGVNAGTYVLTARGASGDGLIGFSTIRVSDIDYPRADVMIGPGMTINTRLYGQPPAGVNLSSIQVSLLPLETFIPEPKPSMTQPTGMLVLSNVQPSDYLLRVSGLPDTVYVKRAQTNQRDVLEQFVRIQYDSNSPLDIELAFDAGQIAGSAVDATGKVFGGATVVLVPDKARRHRPDQYFMTTSAADGKFSIGSIPPGEYKLFAWESIEANAWVNSEVMLNYEELGSAAIVGPGEKIAAQVRLITDQG